MNRVDTERLSNDTATLYPTLAELGTPRLDAALAGERPSELSSGVTRQLEEQSSMKVAIAQIKTLPTRIRANAEKIKEYIDRAEAAGVELVVFPELALPGYSSLDNFQNPKFVQSNLDALRHIVDHTKGKSVAAVVGFVDRGAGDDNSPIGTQFYNSAAVIQDGEILGIVDKTLLPDYDIFWERRYFRPARRQEPVEVNGKRIGFEICEDLFEKDYTEKVSNALADKGADLFINLSASPFHPGKVNARADLVRDVTQRHGVPFLYANLVGAQDGYEGEVVFDGRSMLFNSEGSVVAIGSAFEEDLLILDAFEATPIPLPTWEPEEEVRQALVTGIRDYFERNGFERAYIGLSGGIDSAVTAALAVEALGPERVIGVTMPSHITSEETKSDAELLAQNLGIECRVRPIEKQYRAWEEGALEEHQGKLESITRQNVQARMRGQIMMEYTNEDRRGIVVTTGNKTEVALGYCTLYGDMVGGLAAISDVSKLMVYDVARLVNKTAGREIIPQTTIDRPPTAELEEDQTDEENLPANYDVLSPLVDDIVEHELSREELLAKYPEQIVNDTVRLVYRNEYKRRQAAPGIRVSQKAFGGGRRFPIDQNLDHVP